MIYENAVSDPRILYFTVNNPLKKVAVKDNKNKYSYKELYEKSEAITYQLIQSGVTRGDRVCIFMENNSDYLVCVLAIMQTSAVFVPISPQYPYERLDFILNNCSPSVIITNKTHINKIERVALKNDIVVISIDNIDYNSDFKPIEKMRFALSPKDIAYIIYTSGSTGNPKGVAIRWESLNNYVQDTSERLEFDSSMVTLNMTPFYFDGALTGIFCSLFSKGTLVIVPSGFMREESFIKVLKDEKVTDIGCSPAHLEFLSSALKKEDAYNFAIKTIAIGGQSFSEEYIKEIINYLPNVKILNRYGPTETTIVVSSYHITLKDIQDNKPFPIGKPIRNVTFHARNDQGLDIKPGEIGELYISGIQIMECYWNDPILTNQVIFEDMSTGMKMYRSGDLVTIDEESNYIFIGRKDDMIKKSGYRIYLSEVENALKKLSYINDAYCLVVDNNGSPDIVSFVILEKKYNNECDIDYQVRLDLSKILPVYMLPQKIKTIVAFPITNIGKINRTALKELI